MRGFSLRAALLDDATQMAYNSGLIEGKKEAADEIKDLIISSFNKDTENGGPELTLDQVLAVFSKYMYHLDQEVK